MKKIFFTFQLAQMDSSVLLKTALIGKQGRTQGRTEGAD